MNTNLPKLTRNTHGQYLVYYRKPNGVPGRKKFTHKKRESEILYHRWLLENYDSAVVLANQDSEVAAEKVSRPNTLGVIAKAYAEHTTNRTRKDDDPPRRGLIGQPEAYAIQQQTLNILAWAKEHFGEAKIKAAPFGQLWAVQDYESMMLHFTKKYKKNTQINKHRQRFWALASFATRHPFEQELRFRRESTARYGGDASRKDWSFPTPAEFRRILKKASEMERTWIWMALGLGFGQTDISGSKPICFDADSYAWRRGKAGMERFGEMRPMTWAWIVRWLSANPRRPHELLFVTPSGKPYTRRETKTDVELRFGTDTHGPKRITYKSCDILGHKWVKLVRDSGVEWRGGFYTLRHIACTAFANQPDITLAKLRTFMGHGDTQVVDRYLKHLTPSVKQTVEWVNEMLANSDPMGWDADWTPIQLRHTGQKGHSGQQEEPAPTGQPASADGNLDLPEKPSTGDERRRKRKRPAA